jgi:hypothetical protein
MSQLLSDAAKYKLRSINNIALVTTIVHFLSVGNNHEQQQQLET